MKYCSQCGKELVDEAVVCPNYGCAVQAPVSQQEDKPSTGLNILAFLFPLVYAVLGCVVFGALIAVCTQRCPFCHRYLGMMFFSGKKTYCPHCGSDVHAGRNV